MEHDDFIQTVTPYLGKYIKQSITYEQMRNGVPKGTCHQQGIKYATFLVGVQKFDYATALAEMVRWNQLCQPTMDENDLKRMVQNALGYVEATPRQENAFAIKLCEAIAKHPEASEKDEQQEKEREAVTPLEHINNIENPELIGKNVGVEAVLSSTSVAYTVPSEVRATIKAEDDPTLPMFWGIEKKDTVNVSLIGVPTETKINRLKTILSRKYNAKVTQLEELKHRTIYMVRVRPPVFTLEKRGDKLVDEKGYEYKSIDIYVASDSQIVFQPSTLIKIEGVPLPHPRTQKTTLLAYSVSFPEDIQNFARAKSKIRQHERFGAFRVDSGQL